MGIKADRYTYKVGYHVSHVTRKSNIGYRCANWDSLNSTPALQNLDQQSTDLPI